VQTSIITRDQLLFLLRLSTMTYLSKTNIHSFIEMLESRRRDIICFRVLFADGYLLTDFHL